MEKGKVKLPIKMNIKKIGSFLKSLNEAEYMYIRHTMDLRNAITSLMRKYDLKKEDIIKRFVIKPAKYNDFIKGNYNYSVHDMAIINSTFMEFEIEALAKKAPVQIKQDKN